MKKKRIKKGVSLLLAGAMMLALAACGKTGKQGGTAASDPNLAKQYVYACQDIVLPESGDNFNVETGVFRDGRIYLINSIWNYMETGSTQELQLLSLKEDGSDMQTVSLQLPKGETSGAEEGDAESGDAEASDEETADEETADEGTAETASEDIAAMQEPLPDEGPSYYESTSYHNFLITEDGFIYGVKNYSFEDYSNPENYVSTREETVLKWDMNGALVGEYPMEPIDTQNEWLSLMTMVPMEDGSLVLVYNGDSFQTATLDKEGNLSPRAPRPELDAVMQMGANLMVKGVGELLCLYYDETDFNKMYIATYDMETNTLSEGVELPASFIMSGYNAMMPGWDTDLLYTDGNGVYTLNIGDTESKQIMSFVNSDMNISYMSNVIMLDENRFVGLYQDSINWNAGVGIFTKVNPEDIPDKSVIQMAGSWIDSDVKQRVVEFNKASREYRIVLKEYNKYNTPDDFNGATTQLNNDILASGMPEILIVDHMLPMSSYISKGLIADVRELIEQDEELSQVEFMENVFEAYSVDGGLYQVIPYFNIMTLTGKQAYVGDASTWTMADMQAALAKMPEGAVAMSDMTQSYFINMMMQYCGSDFVDVSTGKCAFDSQSFIDMLEYAKTLPAEMDSDYYDDEYWQTYESQYRDDKTLLMSTYISTIAGMNTIINGSFGEPVTFTGFPNDGGSGSVITVSNTFALSAKSKNLDGAWEFIRYYLTEEYQESVQYGLPVSKAVFDKKAEEALSKPYYLDENGEKVEYTDTFYMNGESIELEPMTKEQVDQVVDFITSVKSPQYYNEEINNIITEEAAAFFAGQKSAQEVAGIIQSRAQIFVSENS